MSMKLGWCVIILHDSRHFGNLTLSLELYHYAHKNEELTEDRYSKRLRNWSENASEHEPGD